MLGITGLTLERSTMTAVSELRAVLADLRADALDTTPRCEAVKWRSSIWMATAV